MDEYVTVLQAAHELGLSERGVRRRISTGELVAERIGRDWMIARVVLDAQPHGRLKPGPKAVQRAANTAPTS